MYLYPINNVGSEFTSIVSLVVVRPEMSVWNNNTNEFILTSNKYKIDSASHLTKASYISLYKQSYISSKFHLLSLTFIVWISWDMYLQRVCRQIRNVI